MKLVEIKAVQLNLRAIVDELKKSPTIENADLEKGSIHVFTKKGDVVSFNEHSGSLHAWVQGQKDDIDVGAIGSSAADILEFLKGINKAWYREYDEHFNESRASEFGAQLSEGFWAVTNKYALSDDPKKDSKNYEDFLNIPGVPGGMKVLQRLETLLQDSKGEITDAVLAWRGPAPVRTWLRWVKENDRKVKKNEYGQYLSY